MKKQFLKFILIVLAVLFANSMMATNTVTNVTGTITKAQTVSTAVDYTIKATTPFSGSGSVNITNTDYAVVIFANIKPTVVLSTWLSYIKINGVAAVNGTNCQVKQYGKYGHGTIIMPYASDFAPLTCYTGQNYSGTSCSSYTTGSDGGYMKTLTSDNLNNQIRSFKLKRGYMVTFSVGTGGWGYSRCFVADDADLEFSTLPACMDGKISSYRLFQWRDFGKAGLANNTSASDNGTLNSSWCYTFNVGSEINEDCEIVTHRVQKWWPGIADCGKVETPIMKTDNEPANSSDDNPATVDEVLGYWENAMRTGKRLCSPSDYDGDNTWLPDFFNKIDARGWRCDIYDIHCYWPVSSYSSLQTYYNNFKRPIMISELMWGASWSSTGIFNSSTNTQADMLTNGKTIVDELNSWDYIESYAWWNSESTTASKVIENGTLTSFGSYYANMATGLGYNKTYDYIPKVVISTPSGLSGMADESTVSLSWSDKNGDMIDNIKVQYKTADGTTWTTLGTVTPQDKTSSSANTYTYNGKLANASSYYWRIVDVYDNTEYASDVLTDLSNNYYFYNVEAGAFLCAGNSWGTQASLSGSGLIWTINSTSTDGLYKLSRSGYSNYLGSTIESNGAHAMWVDRSDDNTTFAITQDSETGYTLISQDPSNTTFGTAKFGITYIGWVGQISKTIIVPCLRDGDHGYSGIHWILMDLATYNNCQSIVSAAWTSRKAMWPYYHAAKEADMTCDEVTIYENPASTASEISSATETLKTKLYAFATEKHPVDVSFILTDPDCESSSHTGWTMDGTWSSNTTYYRNENALLSDRFYEVWCTSSSALTDRSLTQSISSLHAGRYQLSLDIVSTLQSNSTATITGVNLVLGDKSVSCSTANGVPETFTTPALIVSPDESCTLGLNISSTNANWVAFDNFRLRYLGPITGDINADGTVTIEDVAALIAILNGAEAKYNTDVNNDGSTNILDIEYLKTIILQK